MRTYRRWSAPELLELKLLVGAGTERGRMRHGTITTFARRWGRPRASVNSMARELRRRTPAPVPAMIIDSPLTFAERMTLLLAG